MEPMRKIDLVRARKMVSILETLELLHIVLDDLDKTREPNSEIVINRYCIDIDTVELRAFVNDQINSKAMDFELQFGLDAR